MTKKELADRLIEENNGRIVISRTKLAKILKKRTTTIGELLSDLPAMYDRQHHSAYFIDDVATEIMKKGLY